MVQGRTAPFQPPSEENLARSVEEAIRLAGGDIRAALTASLIANAYMEVEIERLVAAVARSFVRGRLNNALDRRAAD